MSAGYTNLRTVSYRDTIAELLDRAKQTHTRATGVQVFSPGDGMAYEDSEGFINPVNPALIEEAKDQIAEASEALVAAEAELEAAQGRIDETTALLERLDEQAGLTAEEMKAVEDRLAQNEADLEAARDALTKADADAAETLAALGGKLTQNTTALAELSSDLGRVDSAAQDAADKADTASQKLSAAETRLNTTQSTLEALVPRVGSVETAVRASDEKMTRLSSEATEASSAAQQAMSAAQAAEARVQALANAQGSLILNGGFEQPVDETAEWRYATTAAHGGSYVGRFLLSSGNRDITWPQARAARGQSLELRYWARGLGGYSNTAMQAYIVVEKNDGTVQSVYSTSDSIIPKLSQNWQEFVFRFAPLPEGTRSVTPRTGVRPSGGDGGYVFMDDVTLHDIASYQEALDAALAARAEAERASQEALDAMERANAAYDSASGKNSIRNATTAPQGVGTATGDVWRRWSAYPGGTVTAEWAWDGTAWRPQQLSHQMLSSLDLGKATVGQLHGSYITAGSIGADRMTIGVGVNALADPYFTDADLRARRSSASTGAWTYSVSGSRPCMELTTPVTGVQTFRYAPLGTTGLIPTVAGRKWRIEVPMYLSGGQARINVRWYDALGSAFSYAAAGAYASGPGDVTIVGEVESPSQAVGFLVDVYMPASSVARTAKVYGGASVVSKTGTVHIEDGAVKAQQVDAQSVAGAVGQFVKVQANNVEVTEALSARVVEALSATSKRLVVTEDAILNRATVIQELVAPVVKATKVSTDQLIAGTASLDTATANKLFADIFAANKITAAQIVVGGLPSAALADGAVSAVKIADGAVTAGKVTATEELSAKILRATSAEVATQFVTDRLVIGTGDNAGVLEVLGKAITNDLNVRGKLRGRDAILAGTLDVKQLNVTEDMAAQIVSAMTVNTKKLVVTEAAVMQHVTAIEGIITPKIEASEARVGDLIAQKASIKDIQAGNITMTGHFRSGAVGMPGVIIPKNYTTQPGVEQLGMWLAPDGKAPSLGDELGRTAGIWLDTASNKAGSTNSSQLNIRGQNGRGAKIWGDLQIVPASNSRANVHSDTDIGLISAKGKLWGQGNALHYVARNGDMEFQSFGKGGSTFEAAGSGDMGISSTTSTHLNAAQDLNLRGFKDVWLKAGNSIKLARPNNEPYIQSWTGSGLRTVYIGESSGTVYTTTSTKRAKVDIETAKPDHTWLDMRTVTYRDRGAVELKESVEARRAAGDCTPLTAEETELLNLADQVIPGRIAEEGAEIGSPQVVYGSDGRAESWDYSRDAVMLTPHVREHRDKIADLEARIAELESALL